MQIYMMVFNNVPLLPDWYLSKDDIFPQRLSETLLQMPWVASWLQHTDNLYFVISRYFITNCISDIILNRLRLTQQSCNKNIIKCCACI